MFSILIKNKITNKFFSISAHNHFWRVMEMKQNAIKSIGEKTNTDVKFQCGVCKKSFASKGYLKYHHKHFHERSEKMFKCDTCEKEFYLEKSLKVHISTSHFGAKFNCESCDKSYFAKGDLQKHFKTIHEKKYVSQCPSCNQTFVDKRSLNNLFT